MKFVKNWESWCRTNFFLMYMVLHTYIFFNVLNIRAFLVLCFNDSGFSHSLFLKIPAFLVPWFKGSGLPFIVFAFLVHFLVPFLDYPFLVLTIATAYSNFVNENISFDCKYCKEPFDTSQSKVSIRFLYNRWTVNNQKKKKYWLSEYQHSWSFKHVHSTIQGLSWALVA